MWKFIKGFKKFNIIQETQLAYHAPDFGSALPFLDKAFQVYTKKYCNNGGGGSFVINPQRRDSKSDDKKYPSLSIVLSKLKKRKKGIRYFSNKEFLKNLTIN